MFQPQFEAAIHSGAKTTTIRKSARCAPGDVLSLRRWADQPYRSKHIVFGLAVCESVSRVSLGPGVVVNGVRLTLHREREAFARADGFGSFGELLAWFARTHSLPFYGEQIAWGPVCEGDR